MADDKYFVVEKVVYDLTIGPRLNINSKESSIQRLFPADDRLLTDVKECLQSITDSLQKTFLQFLCELLLASCREDLVILLWKNNVISPSDISDDYSLMHLAAATGSSELAKVLSKEGKKLCTTKDNRGSDAKFMKLDPKRKRKKTQCHHDSAADLKLSDLAKQVGSFYHFAIALQELPDVTEVVSKTSLLHTLLNGGLSFLPHIIFLCNKLKGNIQDLLDENGTDPLSFTAQQNQYILMELLITTYGCKPNQVCSVRKWSPLHFAADSGSSEAVNILLKRGANPFLKDHQDRAPKYYAEQKNHQEIVEPIESFILKRRKHLSQLLKSNNLQPKDLWAEDLEYAAEQSGKTLLMEAVELDNPVMVEKFLKLDNSGKFKNMKDNINLQTAVCIASKKDCCRSLQVLLEYHCDPSIPDKCERLPLHHACANFCEDCVATITSTYEGLNGLTWAKAFLDGTVKDCKKSQRVRRLIKFAIKKRQQKVVFPYLLKAAKCGTFGTPLLQLEEEDKNTIRRQLPDGKCPVLIAIENGHLNIVKALVEMSGLGVLIHAKTQNSSLHFAVQSGNKHLVLYILKEMKRCSLFYGSVEDSPCDINRRNAIGAPPLEYAASCEIVDILLRHQASPCIADSNQNPVQLTSQFNGLQFSLAEATKERARMIGKLLKNWNTKVAQFKGIWEDPFDHNLISENGDTMLMISAAHSRLEVFSFLLKSLLSTAREEFTKESYYDQVENPLQKQNALDGCTASHRAAEFNRYRNLELLLQHDLRCGLIKDFKGRTPFHYAALKNHKYSTDLLKKHKAI